MCMSGGLEETWVPGIGIWVPGYSGRCVRKGVMIEFQLSYFES